MTELTILMDVFKKRGISDRIDLSYSIRHSRNGLNESVGDGETIKISYPVGISDEVEMIISSIMTDEKFFISKMFPLKKPGDDEYDSFMCEMSFHY